MTGVSQLTYEGVIEHLRRAYDGKAQERETRAISDWKIEERARFLSLLQAEGKRRLLEIGAGAGHHARFFQDSGLEVVCTDLSPEMVRLCREKGLTAYVMDFMGLDFAEGSFDAVFALNCLVHVPRRELPRVLQVIRTVLSPGGLFYLGVYGGRAHEGVWPEDTYEPKRFFCFQTDEQLCATATEFFELVRFERVPLDWDLDFHFQSLTLRREPNTVVEAAAESLDIFIPLLDEVGQWLWDKGVKQWALGTFQGDRDRLRFLVENGCLLLAYQGQRLAGGCILTEVDPGWSMSSAEAMYLSSLAVARFAAGQGLGDRIVDGCVRAARRRGKSQIRLDCWDGNEFLKSFYRRLGFRMLEAVQERDYYIRLFEKDVETGGDGDEQS